MRYLYRSYCLKEGAFGRGILRSWMEVKQQRTEKVYRQKEGRGWGVETDVTTQHLKGWSEKAVFLDTKLGLRVHESLYHWGIYTHWVKSTTRQVCGRGGGGCGRCGAGRGGCWAQAALFFLSCQQGIHFLLRLEHVPLSDGSPWVGQHIWPVTDLGAWAVQAHKHFADCIVLANLVIVQDSYNNLNFL